VGVADAVVVAEASSVVVDVAVSACELAVVVWLTVTGGWLVVVFVVVASWVVTAAAALVVVAAPLSGGPLCE
jgi:hypothetical protein